jgi:hypothetical protein
VAHAGAGIRVMGTPIGMIAFETEPGLLQMLYGDEEAIIRSQSDDSQMIALLSQEGFAPPNVVLSKGFMAPSYIVRESETDFRQTLAREIAKRGAIEIWLFPDDWSSNKRAVERIDEDRLGAETAMTGYQALVQHKLSPPKAKPTDIRARSRNAAGDCYRLDPETGQVTEIIPNPLHNEDTPQKLVAAFLATAKPATDLTGAYLLWRDRLPERVQREVRWGRKPVLTADYWNYLNSRSDQLEQIEAISLSEAQQARYKIARRERDERLAKRCGKDAPLRYSRLPKQKQRHDKGPKGAVSKLIRVQGIFCSRHRSPIGLFKCEDLPNQMWSARG